MSPPQTGGPPEPDRHVLVLDCNIYLDIARVVGPPFTWDKFDAHAARCARVSVPHPDGPHMDSLRVAAMCTSGRFAGDEPVEVWTNAHIERIVLDKAMQSTTPNPESGYRGLGWSRAAAESLVEVLISDLEKKSNGGTLGSGHFPDGNPPLDHEDGMVFGACRALASQDLLSHVYCVTRDRGFLKCYKEGHLGNHTRVVNPTQLVETMRRARAQHSMRAMFPSS